MTSISSQKRMLVSVVTYSGIADTIEFLTRILPHLRESGFEYRIILIDNYERYSQADVWLVNSELKKHFPAIASIDLQNEKDVLELSEINYVFTHRNLGYAKGNNLAFTLVSKGFESDYFLVMGNDVFLRSEDFFRTLTGKLDSLPDTAMIGPKVTGHLSAQQGPYRYQSITVRYFALLFYPILRIFSPGFFLKDQIYGIEEGYVYRLIGCFLLMKSKLFAAVDRFDEGTFLFAEEFILAERFLKIGMKNYYYGKLAVQHNESLTIKKYHDQRSRNRLRFVSDMYYYKKYCHATRVEELLARFSFRVYDRLYCSLSKNISDVRKG